MRKSLIISICVVSIIAGGCQQTPSTTIINNAPVDTTPIETETPIDVDKLTVVTMIEEEVNEVLECGDITVTLSGTISKPDTLEGLCTYKAEIIDYSEYESNMMFLFGEYEDLAHRNERSQHIVASDGEKFGYYASIVNSSLYDENNYTGVWGSIFFSKSKNPVSEEYRKVNMTNEEAIAQADEILDKIGIEGFALDGSSYYEEVLQITPEGTLSSPHGDTLSVYYAHNLQGVPVGSCTIARVVPHARVTFDSVGVSSVSISEYTYEVFGQIDKCISYEEALEKFKDCISRDAESNGLLFDRVRFEYTLTNEYIDGKFEIVVVPYWHFYYEGIPGAAVTGVDVMVNAINGSVTR